MEPDESKTVRIPVEEALEQHREELVPTIGQEAIAANLQPEVGQLPSGWRGFDRRHTVGGNRVSLLAPEESLANPSQP